MLQFHSVIDRPYNLQSSDLLKATPYCKAGREREAREMSR